MTSEQADPLQDPDVNARRVAGLQFGFIVFVGVALAGLGFYFEHLRRGGAISSPRPFPPPQLETSHGEEIGKLRTAQRDRLQTYSWVDRGQGLLRIPVARAMQIIAARGASALDPFPPAAQPSKAAP